MIEEQFNKLSFWGKLGVIFGLGVALLVVSYYYFPNFAKKGKKIKKTREKISELEREISQLQGVKEKLSQFKKEIKRLRERLDMLLNIIPTKKQIDGLLRKLDNMADETNITTTKYSSANITKKDLVSEYTFNIHMKGKFHELGKFFDKIRTLDRIIYTENLKINRVEGGASDSVEADCKVTTFLMPESEEKSNEK